MKKIILLTLSLFSLIVLCGCGEYIPPADEVQQQQQEVLLRQSTSQTGMPAIKNFQERKLMKMILELRDQEKLITYVYLFNELKGSLVFIGKAMGYGLPYSTQYTNPEKINEVRIGEYVTTPQADPNGLFSPASAAGTWVMLIDPKTGTPHPVYMEPNVIVSPFPLQ